MKTWKLECVMLYFRRHIWSFFTSPINQDAHSLAEYSNINHIFYFDKFILFMDIIKKMGKLSFFNFYFFKCFFTAGRFRIGPCQVRPHQDVFERSSDSLVPSARCPPRLYRVLDAYRHVVRIVCWKSFLLLPFFPVQLSFLLPLSYISHTIPFHYSIPILILCACCSRLGHRRRRHDDVRHSFLMVFQLCSPLSFEQWQQ